MTDLDDRLLEAMRYPARIRMNFWAENLRVHCSHQTFKIEDWVVTREIGFSCECSGEKTEWKLTIPNLRAQLPEVRNSYNRLRQIKHNRENKKHARAERKSRDLLYRYLNKSQKAMLRASKSFDVMGQDGRKYRIYINRCRNVKLLNEDGSEGTIFCIIPKDIWMPTHDIMLAQKVMLECDIENFMKTARTNEIQEESLNASCSPPLRVTNDDLDNATEWVNERIQEAEEVHNGV